MVKPLSMAEVPSTNSSAADFSVPVNSATRAERKEFGKAARQRASLDSQSKTNIKRTGRDIVEVLSISNLGRIPELIPLRYGRMLQSPFNFFRGSAALMAMDLAATPNTGIIVQACGDCHIHNFGAFATPERKIVADINDFDETLPAPWEWDVKRLAASLVLAATTKGFSIGVGQNAAIVMARAYREQIALLAGMTSMEVWYSHIEVSKLIEKSAGESRRRMQQQLQEAVEKSTAEVLMEKLTVVTNGRMRFRDIPPLLCHLQDIHVGEETKAAFQSYRSTLTDDRRVLLDKFELVDIARKVVGIGSVGTVCGVLLFAGAENDALVLQIKEARPSVLEPFAGKSKYAHHGQRVVCGQKLMQAASDMFLGWTTGREPEKRHFFIRQLRDVKIGVNTGYWSKGDFEQFPQLAGEILARAHARSGDPSILRGYLGRSERFDEAIGSYAVAYAKQTEHDYHQFVRACKTGVLKAQVE